MGSVISHETCPRCKQENLVDDFYYKTGEVYRTCPDCGYYYEFSYKRDKEGRFILKDESKPFSFDNLISKEVHLENPYGTYRAYYSNNSSVFSPLPEKEDFDEFKEYYTKKQMKDHDITELHLIRFNNGVFTKIILKP